MPEAPSEGGFLIATELMPLDILSRYLGILLAIVLTLFGSLVFLRIRSDQRTRHFQRRFKEWEGLLFRVIAGEEPETLSRDVMLWEYRAFSEFIYKSLANLSGEPLMKLTEMCRRMGLVRYHIFMLRLGNEWQKIYAAHFLGLLQVQESRDLLRQYLKDSSYGVAFACACAINRLGEKGRVAEALRRKDWKLSVTVTLLLGYGPRVGETLIEVLSTKDVPCDRLYALADFIGFLRFLPAESLLLKILKENRDEELSIRCVKALGLLGSPSSFSQLRECLNSKSWVVRCQAAKSLGFLKAEDTAEDLESLLRDPMWQVRHNAAAALLKLGEKGLAILERGAKKEAAQEDYAQDICRQALAEFQLLKSIG